MARVRTLNELSHLRETGYSQLLPRHGLSLLWWFAHKCVEIDAGKMVAVGCDPEHKDFGFHPFHNKERLLPDIDLPYYELGNLHYPGTMPKYVTKNYDPNDRNSNADRIIVSVDSDCDDKWFDRIYVTHHLGQGHFDEDSTYRISQGLIEIIQSMNRADFIRAVKIQ